VNKGELRQAHPAGWRRTRRSGGSAPPAPPGRWLHGAAWGAVVGV